MDEIKVGIIDRGRKYLYMRYLDPLTGKFVERSAGTQKRSEAVKAAGKWEAELREGRYQKPTRIAWEAFRHYYEANGLPMLAISSQATYEATLNVLERLCNPQRLADVTTALVTSFTAKLRESGVSEATVGRHLRHLKVILRWAQGQGLLHKLPTFNMPKRVKGSKVMKGRPITTEEFERMIEAVPKVVENVAAESWRFYLKGLWESGLRLTESLVLRWDDSPGSIVVDFTGKRPMLRIPAEAHKGNRDMLLPMTPEFAALLQSVSESERWGRVFKLLAVDGTPLPEGRHFVGPVVSAIGKAAGVVVDEHQRHGKAVRKYASAHDCRRAFAVRWAAKIMPTQLRELMRHTDIQTTMKFYIGHNAEATADAIWAAVGDTLGDTNQGSKTGAAKNTANSSGDDRS